MKNKENIKFNDLKLENMKFHTKNTIKNKLKFNLILHKKLVINFYKIPCALHEYKVSNIK